MSDNASGLFLGRDCRGSHVRLDGKLLKASLRISSPGQCSSCAPGRERVAIDSILLGEKDVKFDTSAITGESVHAHSPGKDFIRA